MQKITFDLSVSPSPQTEKLLENFGVRKIGERKIEMILADDESTEDAIKALARLDIEVIESHNLD